MKKQILEILEDLKFNQDLINTVNAMNTFDSVYENPYHNLEALKSVSDYDRFLLSLHALVFAKEAYQKLGIPPFIFKESMEDLNLRSTKYYENNKQWGIKETDLKWLNMLFNLKLFKLNSLRFQIFPMDYLEMERSGQDFLELNQSIKKRFPDATPLINIHIETNTNLNEEAVDKSLILAQSFFSEFFPDYKPEGFITRTWLLHPSLRKLLPIDSNIISFASRFEILGLSNNHSQALVRIYGSDDLEKIRRMKKITTLQKGAFSIYQDLGVGIGFLEMKGNLNDKSSLPQILRQ